MYPFPVAQVLNPYHAELSLCCVCVERRGLFLCCCFFVMLFFRIQSLTPNHFLTKTNRIWKNILIDNIYNANIFQVAC